MTGHELKQLRLALGWSQTHMADFFDVDYNTVHRWEQMEKVPRIVEIGQKELIGMIGKEMNNCPRCDGDGDLYGKDGLKTCPYCDGTGKGKV